MFLVLIIIKIPVAFFKTEKKSRGTRDQIANIHWIIEKARNSRKMSTSASLTVLRPLCGSQQTMENS